MKRVFLLFMLLTFGLSACAENTDTGHVQLKWRPDVAAGIYEMVDVYSGGGLAWSPDGRTVATLWYRMGYPDFCLGCKVGSELYTIDLKTMAKTRLAEDRFVTSISWLPDSMHLAYGDYRFDEIRAMGLDGKDDGKLKEVHGVPVWSPDGTRIAAWGSVDGPGRRYPVIDIYDQTGKKLNTVFKGDNPPRYWSMPSWSPNGTQLAFAYASDAPEERGPREAYILDLRSGHASRIGNETSRYVGAYFAPMGKLIALPQAGLTGQIEIWELGTNCSVAVPLTHGYTLSWGPDGRRFVVESYGDTYLVNLNELLGQRFAETGSLCK